MGSDRMVTNESLALGHTAAFNKSGCVFPSREEAGQLVETILLSAKKQLA